MPVSQPLIFTTLLLLLATTSAQSPRTHTAATATTAPRLHVVDQSGLTQGSYRSLAEGVNAARSGDSVVVRRGTYKAVTVHKGIRILGEAGAQLDVTYNTFTVSHLPRNHTLVLSGFEFLWPRTMRIRLEHNQGRIHLSNLRVPPMLFNREPSIEVKNSAFVSLDRCITHGTPALRIENSEVLVSRCELQGVAHYRGMLMGHAIEALRSKVVVCQPYLRGYSDPNDTLASPAVRLNLSEMWIKGDQNSYLQGGNGLLGIAVPAIDGGHFSRLDLDPATPLNPFRSGSPPISARTMVIRRPLAMVTAGGHLTPAGILKADLLGPPGALSAIVVGIPQARRSTFVGFSWLEASSAISLGIGVSDAQGRFRLSFRIPAKVTPGSCILLQGLVDAGQGPMLTLPSVAVIH